MRIVVGHQILGRYFSTAPRFLEVTCNLEEGLERLRRWSHSHYGLHFSFPFEIRKTRRLPNHVTPRIALSTWVVQLQGFVSLFWIRCPTGPNNYTLIFCVTFGKSWKRKNQMVYFSDKLEESFVGIQFSQFNLTFLYDHPYRKKETTIEKELDLIANFSFLNKIWETWLIVCSLETTKIKRKQHRKSQK